jgi:thiol-disulfide isomerase/thioredoxin
MSALRCLALVAVCACAATPLRPSPTLTRVPVLAPDARTPIDLAELARGRPIVVDLFATWCEACREALPRMNELARRHAGGDVLVVGVDVGEDRPEVERYAARAGVTYPVYYDPELRFQDSLGVTALPLVIVFDGAGRVVHRSARLDDETLRVIERLSGGFSTAAGR